MKKIILFLIILLVSQISATDKYIPYYFTGESTDSVMIIKYCITTPAWDTTTVSSFPSNDSFVVDDSKDYSGFYKYFYTGDTTIPSLVGQFFIKGTASTTSDTLAIARAVTRDIVDSAIIRTDVFYGPGAGEGVYTHYTLVMDSGATPDSVLYNINVFCYNSAGSFLGKQRSLANGLSTWHKDSGSYTFKVSDARYVFTDSIVDTITTNGDTTVIYLYDNADANMCNVCGYVTNLSGDSLSRCQVEFWLVENSNNTADSSIILPGAPIITSTNDNGYFSQKLYYSSVVGNKDYQMRIRKKGYASLTTTITVPDSATYKVNFNL